MLQGDLDLKGSDQNFARDTLFCYENQLYQTISKFHHKQQSYGPEVNMLQGYPVTLMVATRIVRMTRRLVMTIMPNNILIQQQSYGPETNVGPTDRQRSNYMLPPPNKNKYITIG